MPTATAQIWTLGKLLDWTTGHLKEKGSEFPRLDAEVLLAHAQGCRRIELYTRYDEIASDAVRTKFKELVRKRIEGCPVAYLVGRKEFFSLELEVSPAVLIPRPDTETLVTACLELAKPHAGAKILDVGTGSGAIAIAIAKNHPTTAITAIDISPDALEVAQRNAAKHRVAERIRFLQGDLFTPLTKTEQFDFIVSNPPYIAVEDWDKLPIGVGQYEPKLALDAGPGGYQVIERLIDQVRDHLKPGGWLMIEIGVPQETRVRSVIQKHAGFEPVGTVKDFSGRPRVLKARWNG